MSSGAPSSTLSRLRSRRFALLMWALVINLLLAPVMANSPILRVPTLGAILSGIFFGVVLVAAVFAVSHKRSITTIALVLASTVVLTAALKFALETRGMLTLSHLMKGAFLLFIAALLIRHIFATSKVTLDLISAALCAYLVFGLMCASLFAAIEGFQPGSFHLPGEGEAFSTVGFSPEEDILQVYFSFVTLLTLGYGDVYPVGSLARIVAVLEAFAGQIMMVVLVARLVGVHVAQSLIEPGTGSQDSS
jgi:hypothetical protein